MRARPRRALLWLLPFVAIAACALYLRDSYNWGPPDILAQAIAAPPIAREGLVVTLDARYLVGTDEAMLKSTLLKQGFTATPEARTSCIKPEAKGIEYGPCRGQDMTSEYEQFGDIVCGTRHITIAWSTDSNGKIASLKATRYVACL